MIFDIYIYIYTYIYIQNTHIYSKKIQNSNTTKDFF